MAVRQLSRVPRITIGAGARHEIAALAGSLAAPGAQVLLCADPGLSATGMTDEVAALLDEGGYRVSVFSDIKSDPSVAQADAAADLAREIRAELMVAVGGGSALDLGKAVAAVAGEAAPAGAYALGARPFPPRRLKTICIPTTSGTGSETTRTAILSGPDGAKLWYWGEELKADEVILDPEMTATLPAGLTAATGIDALVHAVEAATNRNAHPANSTYAHESIRLVARHLEAAVAHPDDLMAREGMARAAALAGTAIDNGGTAIAHNIGHALASLRPIHHGRAVGIAMLASLPWTVEGNETAFGACAQAMGARPTAAGFIAAYEALVRRIGLDLSLRDFDGVTPEVLAAQMERPENVAMLRSTRREAGPDDLLALAEATLRAA
ncbi:MAG TPA: iron-containing alcohol dehydrogenase [Lichenihabitans sp.]|jgi:alcohol dehydrogenase class IV|nr:iron-containing alcohol dehydrogenase [Lichenihabitans sp.]